MAIKRKDSHLNEAIDALDYHLSLHGGNVAAAMASLGAPELEFVIGEVAKISKPITGSRYYLENYHVIPTESEGLRTLFPFWDSQEIFYTEIIEIQIAGRPVRVVVLKARQLGISTVAQGLLFHKTITTEVCNSIVVAQDPGQADYLFGMSRLAYDMLPWWMRPETRYQAKGKYLVFDREDEQLRQTNPGLKSNIFVEASNKMSGVGVGKTLRAAHLSEISRWVNAEVLSEQLFPAMNAPDELAMMESTARGRVGFFYEFWKNAWNGKIDWQPIFIEFFRVKKYSKPIPEKVEFLVTKEEAAIRSKVQREKAITITNEQFYWRRNKMQEFIALNGNEWKFFQEFPSSTWQEAFQGSGLCAFDKKKLQIIMETTCAPPKWFGEIDLEIDKSGARRVKLRMNDVDKHLAEGYDLNIPPAENYGSRLRLWELPKAEEAYYIGADVAQGIEGGDFSVAQIMKIGRGPRPDEQVGEWHGWINPTPFASVLYALGMYFNMAEISVETNDIGGTTNNELFRVLAYDKIFRWKQYDKVKNYITDFYGWSTNSKTRPTIIAKMREAIQDEVLILRSTELVDEMMDFSQLEIGGKYQGQSGHDDLTMAMMITNFCAHDSDWATEVAATPIDPEKGGKDYYNTEYSPIYNKPGFRNDLVTQGKARPEDLMYSDMQNPPAHDGSDDWKLL